MNYKYLRLAQALARRAIARRRDAARRRDITWDRANRLLERSHRSA